jgi:hypothetical protein
MRYVSDMHLGLRQKLVLGGLAIVVVVSFGFTLLQLTLTRKARAVFFAREVATSIGDRSGRPFLAIGRSRPLFRSRPARVAPHASAYRSSRGADLQCVRSLGVIHHARRSKLLVDTNLQLQAS